MEAQVFGTTSQSNAVYETVTQAQIDAVRERHGWIVEPIYNASTAILDMPFFDWISNLRTPQEFAPAAKQLYFHSATFPKVMGIMLGLTSMRQNGMMPFYAKHAFGESDHHMMLMQWMLEHNIIKSPRELDQLICTMETNACVNYAYQMALEQDRDGWLVGLNSGIERCSNDFFKAVSPKMHEIGAGDDYFDVHVGADEHHSIMGLEYIEPQNPESFEGRRLISKALEGISLWAAMLHSWIDIDVLPKFNLDGSLKTARNKSGGASSWTI